MKPSLKTLPPSHTALPGGVLHAWPLRRTLLVAGLVGTAATALALWLPLWIGLVLAVVVLTAGLVWRRPVVLVLTLTAAVYLLLGVGYRHLVVAPLEQLAGQRVTLSGQVTQSSSTATVTLEVTHSDRLPRGTRLALYCPGDALALFDTVTVEADLEPIPDHAGSWRRRGVFLYAFPTHPLGEDGWPFDPGTVPLSQALQPLRGHLQDVLYRHLPGEEGDLLAALCLGLKNGLSEDRVAAFRGSGLSHLLVVSGLHLSALAMAVMALLRRLMGLRPAAVVTAGIVLLFIWLMEGTPSVLRAGVTCLVWLGGFTVRRRPDGLNSLGLALLLLLPGSPYFLWDVGFQLSFLATAGVLLWANRIPYPYRTQKDEPWYTTLWRTVGGYLGGALSLCLGATLATLPLICRCYGGFPISGPVANLLAVTPAGWALLIGWLGLLLCAVPWLSWLGHPLLLCAGNLMNLVGRVADLCSPDWAFVPVYHPWSQMLVTGLCILIMVAVVRRLSWRRWLPGAVCVLLLTVAVGVPLDRTTLRITTVSDTSGGLVVQQGGQCVLLLSDTACLTDAMQTAKRQGCQRILLALTVEETTPAAVTELVRENVPVYTLTNPATAGVNRCGAGDRFVLWSGCQITLLNDRWWRLDTPGGDLLFGTDPAAPYPDSRAAVTVYAGGLPPSLPPDTLPLAVEPNQQITLTTRHGKEWSVWKWS